MEELIVLKLNEIFSAIQRKDKQWPSILAGESGCCLFNKMYLEHFDTSSEVDAFRDDIQALAESSIGYNFYPFCGGKAGVNWFFSYLFKAGLIDEQIHSFICDDDLQIAQEALRLIDIGKYDFLHGAIGIAYYLLFSKPEEYDLFFKEIFERLKRLLATDGLYHFFYDFDLITNKTIEGQVNMGLAHGLPSVLKFCIQCYQQNICKTDAKYLANCVIDFLRAHMNEGTYRSYFPSTVCPNQPGNDYSRMAWCYGDLGIGFTLYRAGVILNDNELADFSINILIGTTNRRTKEETNVQDAGLCHGSAGIAHIYNKMWYYTENPIFKEACDFWIKQTMEFAKYDDGPAGYKAFAPTAIETHIDSYILLEGISGIGLALISYLKGDFSWDYCLMLND